MVITQSRNSEQMTKRAELLSSAGLFFDIAMHDFRDDCFFEC